MKTSYSHYIFDLYGTLLDIRTDEKSPAFWRFVAGLYRAYGCLWSGSALRKAYLRMCAEEEDALRRDGVPCPEIRLERVFVRLLLECPVTVETRARVDGEAPDALRRKYAREPDAVLHRLVGSEWVYALANAFRLRSRTRLRLYPGTIPTLSALRRAGKGIYLLSNAQAVFTLPELEQTGLLPCFDRVFISSDLGIKKPQGAFLERLLTEAKLDVADCVMVGNEIECDVAVARACGMDSVYLNTGLLPEQEVRAQLSALPAGETALILSGKLTELLS